MATNTNFYINSDYTPEYCEGHTWGVDAFDNLPTAVETAAASKKKNITYNIEGDKITGYAKEDVKVTSTSTTTTINGADEIIAEDATIGASENDPSYSLAGFLNVSLDDSKISNDIIGGKYTKTVKTSTKKDSTTTTTQITQTPGGMFVADESTGGNVSNFASVNINGSTFNTIDMGKYSINKTVVNGVLTNLKQTVSANGTLVIDDDSDEGSTIDAANFVKTATIYCIDNINIGMLTGYDESIIITNKDSSNYSETSTITAKGTLTLLDSDSNSAAVRAVVASHTIVGFSTVLIEDVDSITIGELDGRTTSESMSRTKAKTTFSHKSDAKGKLTIDGVEYSGEGALPVAAIYGYSTANISDSYIGSIDAQAGTTTTTVTDKDTTTKITTTNIGKLNADDTTFNGSVTGYSTVNFNDSVEVTGNIAAGLAVNMSAEGDKIFAKIIAVAESALTSAQSTQNNVTLGNTKITNAYALNGTLTLTGDNTIEGNVSGFKKIVMDDISTIVGDVFVYNVKEQNIVQENAKTVSGTYIATSGSALTINDTRYTAEFQIGGNVYGAGTVKIDDSIIRGGFYAGNYNETYKNSVATYTYTANGTFTAEDSIIGGLIYGYKTVTLDDTTFLGIDSLFSNYNQSNGKFTYGTALTLNDAKQSAMADIQGFSKITIDESAIWSIKTMTNKADTLTINDVCSIDNANGGEGKDVIKLNKDAMLVLGAMNEIEEISGSGTVLKLNEIDLSNVKINAKTTSVLSWEDYKDKTAIDDTDDFNLLFGLNSTSGYSDFYSVSCGDRDDTYLVGTSSQDGKRHVIGQLA